MIFKTPFVTNRDVPVTLKIFHFEKGLLLLLIQLYMANQTTTCTILKISYMASLTTCNPAADTVAMSVHFLSPKVIFAVHVLSHMCSLNCLKIERIFL